jgi:hypothetical protein
VAYADSAAESAPEPSQDAPRKKVVVLGTGWAGTSFLKNLDCSRYEVKVISPRNYFAFTPLLPSVTCGTVEPRSIIEPVRRMFEKVLLFLPIDYVLLCAQSNLVWCFVYSRWNVSINNAIRCCACIGRISSRPLFPPHVFTYLPHLVLQFALNT